MKRLIAGVVWVCLTAAGAVAAEGGGALPPPDAAAQAHWAFEAVRDVEIPPGPASHPIDRFIAAKQVAAEVQAVERADKRTLIRRASFDLLGLPPTPQEVDRFLADDSPDAFAKLIDRLLASPHYGERWGRHWLDLARYADSAGDNSDFPVPAMWRYRNWVIDALNADMPYDRFITEQLAGDLLPYDTWEQRNSQLIATGYIALSRRFSSRVDPYPMWLTIDDTIDNVGKAMLGLTVACARCHDHKFDPVSMKDYYALYGIFKSTTYPFPGVELLRAYGDLPALTKLEEMDEAERQHYERGRELMAKLVAAQDTMMAADARMNELSAAIAAATDDEARKKLRDELSQVKDQRNAAKSQINPTAEEIQKLEREGPRLDLAYAVTDSPRIADARIHINGEPEDLGPTIPRGFLEVLGGQTLSQGETTSGRLALAQWITDPRNPLTARVMANRIWLHHFGKGLVSTPTDFGLRGAAPTHPELLDYLANQFIAGGWSIKAMHRLIMTSETYQLAAVFDRQANEINLLADPTNALYWRFDSRRLEAEAIRDTMLAVSGMLDRQMMSQPHPFPPLPEWNFSQHRPFQGDPAAFDHHKRSVYLMTQRIQKHPFLALFDGPDTNITEADRTTSTTPLQSLYFMNDPFVHEQAAAFGKRLQDAAPTSGGAGERIKLAYELALSREATAGELDKGASFIAAVSEAHRAQGKDAAEADRLAWESFARVIFRLNEFVYVN